MLRKIFTLLKVSVVRNFNFCPYTRNYENKSCFIFLSGVIYSHYYTWLQPKPISCVSLQVAMPTFRI